MTKLAQVLNLREISEENRFKVGTKAYNLNTLIKNQFSVPKGFVLSTFFYDKFMEQNSLNEKILKILQTIDYDDIDQLQTYSDNIQRFIKEGDLPVDVKEEILRIYKDENFSRVAIRSSSNLEDLSSVSFAGQYSSHLNVVSVEDIYEKVKHIYASLWTSRAILYRYNNNLPIENAKIAVLIQEMIDSKVSGVSFSINPVNSNQNEILIESNYGLGESVMAGKINPDKLVISKNKRDYQNNFKIISKTIGKKEGGYILSNESTKGGLKFIEFSTDERSSLSIDQSDINQLCQISIEIEDLYKNPQDIEWTIDENKHIYIVQTRPITTFKPSAIMAGDIWFSRGYSDDYWNDPTTPLFFDLLGDQLTKIVNNELNDIMGYKGMSKELLRLFKGHVYFNLSVLRSKVINEIPKFIRNKNILNYFPSGEGYYGKKTVKNLPFKMLKRIVAEIRVMLFDPNGAISKTADIYNKWSINKFIPYYKKFDVKLEKYKKTKDLVKLFNLSLELDRKMIAHFRLVRYGIAVHNLGMNLMLQYLLKKFLGQSEALITYPVLISGLNHKLTETNKHIHELVDFVRDSDELFLIFNRNKSVKIKEILNETSSSRIDAFNERFQNFLLEYGERGFSREIFYPRWNDAPEYVFDIIKSLIMEGGEAQRRSAKVNSYASCITEKVVESKLRKGVIGFLKWKIVSSILKVSRRYIKFRENQRFNLDKWISRNRNLFLNIGEILQERKILENPYMIFFLRRKEIKEIIKKKPDQEELTKIRIQISERAKEFKKFEHIIPPKFIVGKREFDDSFVYSKKSIKFTGIPASQGIVQAPIRVLRKIEDIPCVKAGEILVVPKTDPGWTPIFSKIGGLITETGGVLSHGAVVSREYGIPAVTNITNACNLFNSGDYVKIDGNNGIVYKI